MGALDHCQHTAAGPAVAPPRLPVCWERVEAAVAKGSCHVVSVRLLPTLSWTTGARSSSSSGSSASSSSDVDIDSDQPSSPSQTGTAAAGELNAWPTGHNKHQQSQRQQQQQQQLGALTDDLRCALAWFGAEAALAAAGCRVVLATDVPLTDAVQHALVNVSTVTLALTGLDNPQAEPPQHDLHSLREAAGFAPRTVCVTSWGWRAVNRRRQPLYSSTCHGCVKTSSHLLMHRSLPTFTFRH